MEGRGRKEGDFRNISQAKYLGDGFSATGGGGGGAAAAAMPQTFWTYAINAFLLLKFF